MVVGGLVAPQAKCSESSTFLALALVVFVITKKVIQLSPFSPSLSWSGLKLWHFALPHIAYAPSPLMQIGMQRTANDLFHKLPQIFIHSFQFILADILCARNICFNAGVNQHLKCVKHKFCIINWFLFCPRKGVQLKCFINSKCPRW